MIPLNFYLFWAGDVLSYLRFLTFKSLRYHHPNASIKLYLTKEYNTSTHKWNGEGQDFEKKLDIKNYLDELDKLNIEVVKVKYIGSPDLCPILQADIARWLMLKNGGFYLDTDQIILKPFDTLPLDKEFIYCRYMEVQCGDYLPTGVIGVEDGSQIPEMAIKEVLETYNSYNYNSSGPFMMRSLIGKIDLSRAYNASYNWFYPINSSAFVENIYYGRYKPNSESYALHWYGGHPMSQIFNKTYTEEKSKGDNDSISQIVRDMGIV